MMLKRPKYKTNNNGDRAQYRSYSRAIYSQLPLRLTSEQRSSVLSCPCCGRGRANAHESTAGAAPAELLLEKSKEHGDMARDGEGTATTAADALVGERGP